MSTRIILSLILLGGVLFLPISCLSTSSTKISDESDLYFSAVNIIPDWNSSGTEEVPSKEIKSGSFSLPISLYPSLSGNNQTLVFKPSELKRALVAPFWVEFKSEETNELNQIVVDSLTELAREGNGNEFLEVVPFSSIKKLQERVEIGSNSLSETQYLAGMLGANFYVEYLVDKETFLRKNFLRFKAQAVDTFSGAIIYQHEKDVMWRDGVILDLKSFVESEFPIFYQEVLDHSVAAYREIKLFGDYFQLYFNGVTRSEAKTLEEELYSCFNTVMRIEFTDDNLLIGGYGKKEDLQIEQFVFDVAQRRLNNDRNIRLKSQETYSFIYIVENLGYYEKD